MATGGQWWAVWTEFAGTSGPQLDPFQASTIGGTAHDRQRSTTHPLWDWGPVAHRGRRRGRVRRLDGDGQPELRDRPGRRRLGRRLRLAGRRAPPGAGKATALNLSITSRLYATTET